MDETTITREFVQEVFARWLAAADDHQKYLLAQVERELLGLADH